jgi:hypothetical protein
MKAIVRYLILLLLVCGTALAWKSTDRRFRHYSGSSDGAGQKEEGDAMQAALQPLLHSRGNSKAVASWSKGDFQAKLEEAFHKNDPCAVTELLHGTQDAAPRDFWSAGMAVLLGQASERNALLEELLASPDSPFYGHAAENSKTKETRFFNALLFSGQLEGLDASEDQPRRVGPRNLERSIELLKELATEDADNGAYSYFLAMALRQSGAKKEEVRAAMSQAARVAKFDVFYQSIFDELQKVGYTNAATFTFVHTFLENMPAPDYEQGTRYLRYWAQTEEPGKWIAHKIAKRLIDMGSKFKSYSPGYQYSHKEYMLGQSLKLQVEGLQEKSWKDYIEKVQEGQAFISEAPRPVLDAEISLYGERISGKPSCGPEAWKALFVASRSKSEKSETKKN